MHRTAKGVSPSFKQAPGNLELKTEIKISTANKAVAAIVSPLRANQAALYGTADLAPSCTNRAWISLCCTECFISGKGNSRADLCQFHTPVLELLSEHPVPVCLDSVWVRAGHRPVLLQPPASTAFPSRPAGKQEPSMNGCFPCLDTATFIELMCLKANLDDFVPVILRMEGFTLKLSYTHWVWKQSQDTSLPPRLLGSAVPSQHSLKHAGDTQ